MLAAAALLATVGVYYFGTSVMSPSPVARVAGIKVVATFYPLSSIAEGVAGDAADVSSIVPNGVEPHDYEPSSHDVIAIHEAEVFLMNGAGMDAWAEKLKPELEASGVRVVTMSDYAELIAGSDSGSYDPHIWLDPVVAEKFAVAVRDALSAADPAHFPAYRKNAETVSAKLSALDKAYRGTLLSCAKRGIIISHDACTYLARRYGFTVYAIAGLSPEAEPSPRRIAELADFAKKENIRYIFFETLVSPKVSKTLAGEIGAETLVFDPIEGLSPEGERSGADYFSIMTENLQNLATAMGCR